MSWLLTVVTADEPGAGTNADTNVIIYGDQGQSPPAGSWWVLNNPGDDMEQGDVDEYRLDMDAIGVPHTILLWFDPKDQANAEWYCEAMRLLNPSGAIEVRFPVNRKFRNKGWYRIRSGRQGLARVVPIPAGQPAPPPVG